MTALTWAPRPKDHARCFSSDFAVEGCMLVPRLYVAGPMRGYPEYNFPAFEEATQALRRKGYKVTSPHEIAASDGSTAGSKTWEEYMRYDLIEMLKHADAIALLPERSGYPPSRGRKIESDLGLSMGWQVHPVYYWLQQVWFCEARPHELSGVV